MDMLKSKRQIFSAIIILLIFILIYPDLKAVNKTHSDKKAVTESLEQNGKWYVFALKNPTRFKIMGKYDYDHAKEGIFYKGVQFKGKFYLMSENGAVYEPTWETKNNLKQFVVPASQYLKNLTDKLKKCKTAFDASTEKVKTAKKNVEKLKETWQELSEKIYNRRYSNYRNKYSCRVSDAQKKYKNAKKGLKKLLEEHEDISDKYKAADDKYKSFYARYVQLIPVAKVEPERRELTEMIKKVPLKKVKHILQELKQEEEADK